MPRLFCFGSGFSARALIHRLAQDSEQWEVAGTSRPKENHIDSAAPGATAFAFDRSHPLPFSALEQTTHLLISVPPDEDGDPVLDLHQSDLLYLKQLRWVGYLSTTGVYGDWGGAEVDESSPLVPTSQRAYRRVRAEEGWRHLAKRGVPVQIFRLAGIYGPGRSSFDGLRAGTAQRIIKPGQVFSRIHVEDVAAALLASIRKPHPGRIYNVCDDEAAPPQDVLLEASRLLGIAPPPEVSFEQAVLSPMSRSFYSDNKRVSNRRIKEELDFAPRYPSYREGLAAILEQESGESLAP